ncbi:MAG: hypothetical protein GY795_44060 [Desulfobacterales bacterium]|nr:hypothetical protein [Desulfobacterales bacterium]
MVECSWKIREINIASFKICRIDSEDSRKAKESAFNTLKRHGISSFGRRLMLVVEGLMFFWSGMKGDYMKEELTPEKVIEIGKMFEDEIISVYDKEKLLKRFTLEERLEGFSAKEIEDYLKKLKKKQRPDS